MHRLKRITRGLFPLLILIALGMPGARAAGPKVVLDIPAGDASKTLFEFYVQSQVQLLFLADAVKGVTTKAVSGEFIASEALARMLEGTLLTFEFESDYAALIRPILSQSAGVAGNPRASASPTNAAPAASLGGLGAKNVSEVVVTGSHIRGVLDLMTPLVLVPKRQMKTTAYATVQDALHMLPINSGALHGEDFAGNGNFNRGSSVNLRGLGSGATLVLINGRRQPYAGLQADFIDLANVPWSVVERIEVLPDGSSALYGSDAIAGVVNIILRDQLSTGAETGLRLASAPDGAVERFVAQLFGERWDTGKWLLAYQYSQRSALFAADRQYAADSDKRSLGGSNFSSTRSVPGNILAGNFQPAFAIPDGQNGTELTPADLLPGEINFFNQMSAATLLPDKQTHNLFVSGSQLIGQRFELFGEARLNRRSTDAVGAPAESVLVVRPSNPFFVDPFGNSSVVLVGYNFFKDLGPSIGSGRTTSMNGTLGASVDFAAQWKGSLSLSYGEERLAFTVSNQIDNAQLNKALEDPDPATAFNPFGDGSYLNNAATLAAIRIEQRNRAVSDIGTVNFVADGPVFELPSGTAKLAVGLEQRQENLYREIRSTPQHFGRDITAAFAELSAPLIGNGHNHHTAPRLEFSLAGRYEQYSDFGSTFNPKIGLRWALRPSIKLRTSWGTSFKAPKLVDLYDTSQNAAGFAMFPDPLSSSGQSLALLIQGSNLNLREETAATWTAGVDLAPAAVRGLTLSLTGFDINYSDQVIQPGGLSLFDILHQEARWAEVITRNPTRAVVAPICETPLFVGSREQCRSTLPPVFLDIRLRNLASTRARGVDLKIERILDSSLGHFELTLDGSYLFSFKQAFTDSSPLVDILDTPTNPLASRMRGTLQWTQHGLDESGLNMMLGIGHTGSYRQPASTVRTSVDASTTIDLHFGYRTASGVSWWDGIDVSLSAVNIFDQPAPFVDRLIGYDDVNAEPMGRVVGVYFQKNW